MFKEIDHVAILVRDTDKALELYQKKMKLPLLGSEVIEGIGVRLTHLGMGNVQLQLVEPLDPYHALSHQLEERGEGLHHICWKVDDVNTAMSALEEIGLKIKPNEPHPGIGGKEAAFIEPEGTQGVLFEITSDPGRS